MKHPIEPRLILLLSNRENEVCTYYFNCLTHMEYLFYTVIIFKRQGRELIKNDSCVNQRSRVINMKTLFFFIFLLCFPRWMYRLRRIFFRGDFFLFLSFFLPSFLFLPLLLLLFLIVYLFYSSQIHFNLTFNFIW